MNEDKARRAARTLVQVGWATALSVAGALGWEGVADTPVPDQAYAVAVPVLAGGVSALANSLEDREDWLSYIGKALVLWVNKGAPLPRNEDGTFRSPD